MSKTTENYGLTKPEVGEFFSLETWNENMDKIDGELKKREDAQKESDNSLMNPKFTEAKERKNLTSGEKIHLMLGKISRFFSDMKAIAFSGSYNDLVDKPKIPTVLNNQTTTEEGYALDARQANPNIDGTLAKQVADLNGSLKRQEEKGCVLVNATGSASYICNGFMAQVIMEIEPTKLEDGTLLLKGLPRPSQIIHMTLPAINGNNIPCVINYNGEITIYFQNGGNSISRIDHIFCYMYDKWG